MEISAQSKASVDLVRIRRRRSIDQGLIRFGSTASSTCRYQESSDRSIDSILGVRWLYVRIIGVWCTSLGGLDLIWLDSATGRYRGSGSIRSVDWLIRLFWSVRVPFSGYVFRSWLRSWSGRVLVAFQSCSSSVPWFRSCLGSGSGSVDIFEFLLRKKWWLDLI